MCFDIVESAPVEGVGKGSAGWFPLTKATVGYDHATHSTEEHAVLIDFTNYDLGPQARIAVELDLASGWAFLEQLRSALERASAAEHRPVPAHTH